VSDIKTDLRATNQRIDTLEQKMERKFEVAKQDLDKRFDEAKKDNDKRFEKVEERLDRLDVGIVAIKDTLASWKVWAIGLYAGLAGSMFFVMAKGFKWF
jgi:predicted  nucleic acid-binding Zn-ribbon protein